MKVEDILQKLPTREEVARLVGLQPPSAQDGIVTLLSVFGTGLLLGAGLALLFAPKPGQDLRNEIVEKFNRATESFGNPKQGNAHTNSLPA